MSAIKGDPQVIDDAGLVFRRASSLMVTEVGPLRRALDRLDSGSPQIASQLASSSSGLATRLGQVADDMARVGTGLQGVADRMIASDELMSTGFDPDDAGVGGFTLGAANHGDPDLLVHPSQTAGFGIIRDGSDVQVESIYGTAIHRQSDDSWFLQGDDGQWYLLDVPTTDAYRYGFHVTGTREGMVELRGSRSTLDRLASFAMLGMGPSAGGPEDYAYLDWGYDGTEPFVGTEANPAMRSDHENHPTPTGVDGSDIVIGDGTPHPGKPAYGPSTAGAAGVDGFSMLLGGIGSAMNEDGRYQGAKLTFTEDVHGRRRVVVQGASITNLGGPVATAYNVTGFDDEGNPTTEDAKVVTFDMGRAGESCTPLPEHEGPQFRPSGPS